MCNSIAEDLASESWWIIDFSLVDEVKRNFENFSEVNFLYLSIKYYLPSWGNIYLALLITYLQTNADPLFCSQPQGGAQEVFCRGLSMNGVYSLVILVKQIILTVEYCFLK